MPHPAPKKPPRRRVFRKRGPAITFVGIVMNRSKNNNPVRRTSRLHIRGSNFDVRKPPTVTIYDQYGTWDSTAVTAHDPSLLFVKIKFLKSRGSRRPPSRQTGDITVTVTNNDGQSSMSVTVPVGYVNDDDLPP